MKKKTKKLILKIIFGALTLAALALVAIPLIPTADITNQATLDFIQFFVDVKTNITDNATFYLFLLAVLTGGLVFIVRKR